jgi:1-acyl-sn-glycerol-3-phosphate acyltransferase
MTVHRHRPDVHEHFEPDWIRDIMDRGFLPLMDHYFRPRLIGHEKLPKKGPLVLAANHSGTAFPFDGMVLDASLWRKDGLRDELKYRSVYERVLSLHWWMRPFGIDNFWRRAGGVDLTFDNFDRLLAGGERIIYYPEGVPGIGKGFQRRYQLQPFSTSFIILAARHGAPVYPVHIVNAEWVIPFNFTLPPLDWLMKRLFGVPFLPLPGGLFAITFPWAWYLALPARMVMRVGDPIDVVSLLRDEGITEYERPDRVKTKRVAERVRRIVQAELDRAVARYGRWPYQTRLLMRSIRGARRTGKLRHMLPFRWPFDLVRMDRDARREPARGRLHAWLRDWDLIGYYLPFGWPLLTVTRRLRKPPYGYRGMTASERRSREGCYIWLLDDEPGAVAPGAGSAETGSATG